MLTRSEYCGLINKNFLKKNVCLYGWVNKYRNHGNIIFIDLRDREGYVQIVCDSKNKKTFKKAKEIKNEFCLQIIGIVKNRPKNMINHNIKNGDIEISCNKLFILNKSNNLPFNINDKNLSEIMRMKYRVLDLRSSRMQKNIKLRSNILLQTRKYLNKFNFIEIETPFLIKSTTEGARDYLIPSRIYKGNFFALPQSPQLFKQLLMISNFDRYYQITKCFRDEDLRSDRQPEFTQIDCELSFFDENKIRSLFQNMICYIFYKCINFELNKNFPIIKYYDSISRFGSDKPDLRINFEIIKLTDIIKYKSILKINKNDHVSALCISKGAKLSLKKINKYKNYLKKNGIKNLIWIKVDDINNENMKLRGSILKKIDTFTIKNIIKKVNAKNEDIIFIISDEENIVNYNLGLLRLKIGYSKFGKENKLFTKGWKPLWIVDFPMFKYDLKKKCYLSIHHPFTSPKNNSDLINDPLNCLSNSYDLVINGWEIGSGSIRIYKKKIQNIVFKILGINEKKSQEKFGFLLDSFEYGAPPHGGIAFGLDRITAILSNEKSIRDVIAFPKTQNSQDLLINAPSNISKKRINEFHLKKIK